MLLTIIPERSRADAQTRKHQNHANEHSREDLRPPMAIRMVGVGGPGSHSNSQEDYACGENIREEFSTRSNHGGRVGPPSQGNIGGRQKNVHHQARGSNTLAQFERVPRLCHTRSHFGDLPALSMPM